MVGNIIRPLRLERQGAAVVLMDTQEKLAAAMPPADLERMLHNVRILLATAQVLEMPVLVTEQYPSGLGPTLPELRTVLGEMARVFDKVEFDCTAVRGFMSQLADLTLRNVILMGLEAHICILQTAVGLLQEGYNVWVAHDAVCSRVEENYREGLRLLDRAGAVVAPTETIVFSALGRAGTPEFREIHRMIRGEPPSAMSH